MSSNSVNLSKTVKMSSKSSISKHSPASSVSNSLSDMSIESIKSKASSAEFNFPEKDHGHGYNIFTALHESLMEEFYTLLQNYVRSRIYKTPNGGYSKSGLDDMNKTRLDNVKLINLLKGVDQSVFSTSTMSSNEAAYIIMQQAAQEINQLDFIKFILKNDIILSDLLVMETSIENTSGGPVLNVTKESFVQP